MTLDRNLRLLLGWHVLPTLPRRAATVRGTTARTTTPVVPTTNASVLGSPRNAARTPSTTYENGLTRDRL
ncbi:hypothetical protein [Actinopolymorpha pittospori]